VYAKVTAKKEGTCWEVAARLRRNKTHWIVMQRFDCFI
jgi:hypothetical protein